MEHGGSRAAADLSHEGVDWIRECGEPGEAGQHLRDIVCWSTSEARKCSLSLEAARNTVLGKWGPPESLLTGGGDGLRDGGQPAASLRLIATCCRRQLTSHISHRSVQSRVNQAQKES